MKMNEASRYMKSLGRPPEENLSIAIMSGKFPKGRHLNEKERMLARRRILDVEEELSKVLKELDEAEGAASRYLDAQPARNRVEGQLPRHFMDRLTFARNAPKALENERSILQKKIKDSLMAEQIALQEEGERRALTFTLKARKFIEGISEKPDAADLVISLAQSLNGKSLEQAFMPFLQAKNTLEDLEVERRHISETHNISMDELPPAPDLDYVDALKTALAELIGKPLEIPRSKTWRRIWANQRAQDRDAAAKRLGIN